MNQPMNQSLAMANRAEAERSFIARTFMWMTLGLLTTAVVAFVVASSPTLIKIIYTNPMLTFGLLIGQVILVLVLSAGINKLAPMVATLIFFAYAALTGLTFSSIFIAYDFGSIASTFVVTAGMFGILTIMGMGTKRDLTGIGTLAFIGLIGVLLMSLVNMFLRSDTLYWLISILGVIIFVVLIARDAQRLKKMATEVTPDSEQAQRASIMGALVLYLDFINLFLFLLRLLGGRR